MLDVYLGKLGWKKIAVALNQEEETSVAFTITDNTIVITVNGRGLQAVEMNIQKYNLKNGSETKYKDD